MKKLIEAVKVARSRAETELARLASHGSSEAIASHLAECGCRGRRGDHDGCPLQIFLQQAMPELTSVCITGVDALVFGIDYDGNKISFDEAPHVRLPERVGIFVERFDVGDFPELDLLGAVEGGVVRQPESGG